MAVQHRVTEDPIGQIITRPWRNTGGNLWWSLADLRRIKFLDVHNNCKLFEVHSRPVS